MPLARAILAILTLVTGFAWARAVEGWEPEVQKYEFELQVGPTLPLGSYHGCRGEGYMTAGLEFRLNNIHPHWDVGFYLFVSSVGWYLPETGRYTEHQATTFDVVCLGVTTDYNLRQGRRINPYVGLGLAVGGDSLPDNLAFLQDHDNSGHRFMPVVMPRIGVEIMYHLRVGAFMQLSRAGYNSYGFTVGVVIGGRPRK